VTLFPYAFCQTRHDANPVKEAGTKGKKRERGKKGERRLTHAASLCFGLVEAARNPLRRGVTEVGTKKKGEERGRGEERIV